MLEKRADSMRGEGEERGGQGRGGRRWVKMKGVGGREVSIKAVLL